MNSNGNCSKLCRQITVCWKIDKCLNIFIIIHTRVYILVEFLWRYFVLYGHCNKLFLSSLFFLLNFQIVIMLRNNLKLNWHKQSLNYGVYFSITIVTLWNLILSINWPYARIDKLRPPGHMVTKSDTSSNLYNNAIFLRIVKKLPIIKEWQLQKNNTFWVLQHAFQKASSGHLRGTNVLESK